MIDKKIMQLRKALYFWIRSGWRTKWNWRLKVSNNSIKIIMRINNLNLDGREVRKMMHRSIIWPKISSNGRLGYVILWIVLMIFAILKMTLWGSENVNAGKTNLTRGLLDTDKTVELNGQWEFYWNQLLTPSDFTEDKTLKMDSYMNVPDSWSAKSNGEKVYPNQGVATYRIILHYPSTLNDPALRIQNIACAYKIYVDGQFAVEEGTVAAQPNQFKEGTQLHIINLPPHKEAVEVVFQVANLNYAKGGIRQSPVLGSKNLLDRQHTLMMALQLIFIGGVLIFGVYYLLLFVLQIKNRAALIFSLLCFLTGFRSLIWGEVPIMLFTPNISYNTLAYINYITGFNVIPLMLLFIISLYPLEYKKVSLGLVLFPVLLFDSLLFTSAEFMSKFTNYLYLLMLIQMMYMLGILIKAVWNRRDNALLMYSALCIYVLAINLDILHFSGMSGFYDNNVFLSGNIAVIIAMSFVQAKQQAKTHKKLVLYNQNLLDADQLKDKIMATEMSFLHAQIKPHFLYNALDAIANVSEKDGEKGGKLIIDLAIYLRGSLEFNHLDKMSTIEKELEFVDTYFHIEQARFGDKIQLLKEIKAPLDFRIPILILQPLVENAVRHGISKKPGGGTIHIVIEEFHDETCIEVTDNGVGIEEKKVKMILTNERLDQGVGLLNIHHRLQRLYGKGLEITSEQEHHTCVKFVVPRNIIANKNDTL